MFYGNENIDVFHVLDITDNLLYYTSTVLQPVFIFKLGNHLTKFYSSDNLNDYDLPAHTAILTAILGTQFTPIILSVTTKLCVTPWWEITLTVLTIFLSKAFIFSTTFLFGCCTTDQFIKAMILIQSNDQRIL